MKNQEMKIFKIICIHVNTETNTRNIYAQKHLEEALLLAKTGVRIKYEGKRKYVKS